MAAEAHPALSLSTTPDYGNLDPESYTAQRLVCCIIIIIIIVLILPMQAG